MGWGYIIAAWIMGSTGKKPSSYPGARTSHGEIIRTLALGAVSLAIIVAGLWPKH